MLLNTGFRADRLTLLSEAKVSVKALSGSSIFKTCSVTAMTAITFGIKCHAPLSVASTAQTACCCLINLCSIFWVDPHWVTTSWISHLWGMFKASCLFLSSLLLFQLLENPCTKCQQAWIAVSSLWFLRALEMARFKLWPKHPYHCHGKVVSLSKAFFMFVALSVVTLTRRSLLMPHSCNMFSKNSLILSAVWSSGKNCVSRQFVWV